MGNGQSQRTQWTLHTFCMSTTFSLYSSTVNAATPNSIPSPEVLALLGQNLHQFDTWHVPTQQPAIGVETGKSELASPYARALMGSRASVATLCVSGPLAAISTNPCEASRKLGERGVPNIGVVAALASMTNLTTLHLSTTDQHQAIDYQPLTQLSLLRDLASAIHVQAGVLRRCYQQQQTNIIQCHSRWPSLVSGNLLQPAPSSAAQQSQHQHQMP